MKDSWGIPVYEHASNRYSAQPLGISKILSSVSQNQAWSRMAVEFRVNNSARFGRRSRCRA